MRDYMPPPDPYADIEAEIEATSKAERRRRQKLVRWMQAINARIAQLQAEGATSIHLELGDGDELPSLTFSFAPQPKQAAQRIFDDARPSRYASGLL